MCMPYTPPPTGLRRGHACITKLAIAVTSVLHAWSVMGHCARTIIHDVSFQTSQGLTIAQAYTAYIQILPSCALWKAGPTCENIDVLDCFVNLKTLTHVYWVLIHIVRRLSIDKKLAKDHCNHAMHCTSQLHATSASNALSTPNHREGKNRLEPTVRHISVIAVHILHINTVILKQHPQVCPCQFTHPLMSHPHCCFAVVPRAVLAQESPLLMLTTPLLTSCQTPRRIPLNCFPPALHIVQLTNLSYSPEQMYGNNLIF